MIFWYNSFFFRCVGRWTIVKDDIINKILCEISAKMRWILLYFASLYIDLFICPLWPNNAFRRDGTMRTFKIFSANCVQRYCWQREKCVVFVYAKHISLVAAFSLRSLLETRYRCLKSAARPALAAKKTLNTWRWQKLPYIDIFNKNSRKCAWTKSHRNAQRTVESAREMQFKHTGPQICIHKMSSIQGQKTPSPEEKGHKNGCSIKTLQISTQNRGNM